MHKKEIHRLYGTLKQQGLTLIPLSVYFKNGRAKMEVGICKGKKNYREFRLAAKSYCDALRKMGVSSAPECDWDESCLLYTSRCV